MTDYVAIEQDFIKRTLAIIDQYEEFVRDRVDSDHQYEVTLLMNCLLGLLIYPQQLAHKIKDNSWLTQVRVVDVEDEWGVKRNNVRCAGFKSDGTSIKVKQLTLRNLIRQMRNTASHANFKISANQRSEQLRKVEFRELDETGSPKEHGFHLILDVEDLEKFVRRLAQSALERI